MTCSDDDLSCRELVDLVTEYLEGAMDPQRRAVFEEHAEACPACLEHLEQIKLTVRATGSVRRDDISREARDTLLEQFRGWKRGS